MCLPTSIRPTSSCNAGNMACVVALSPMPSLNQRMQRRLVRCIRDNSLLKTKLVYGIDEICRRVLDPTYWLVSRLLFI